MSTFELKFAMPLQFRDDLEHGAQDDWNTWISWRGRFSGKTVYLIGWTDGAYAVVDRLGDYHCENISGHPSRMFEPAFELEHAT